MPLSTQDPFTQIHGAIWAALTAYPPWAAFVPLGARVNFIPGVSPGSTISGINPKSIGIKTDALESGDAPEVRIVQRMFAQDPRGSNSMAMGFRQAFIIQMSTNVPTLDLTPANQLKWLTYLALYKTTSNLGLPNLVRNWDYIEGADQAVQHDSGVKMWISVVPLVVQFFVNKSAMNTL